MSNKAYIEWDRIWLIPYLPQLTFYKMQKYAVKYSNTISM